MIRSKRVREWGYHESMATGPVVPPWPKDLPGAPAPKEFPDPPAPGRPPREPQEPGPDIQPPLTPPPGGPEIQPPVSPPPPMMKYAGRTLVGGVRVVPGLWPGEGATRAALRSRLLTAGEPRMKV